jgi:hypothetical protein
VAERLAAAEAAGAGEADYTAVLTHILDEEPACRSTPTTPPIA